MVSLARAFTQRRAKMSEPFRRREKEPSNVPTDIRAKISSPLHLLHTTNMLSYNAPDIVPSPASSSSTAGSNGSLTYSDDDSDVSAFTVASTPPRTPHSSHSSTIKRLAPSPLAPSPAPELRDSLTFFSSYAPNLSTGPPAIPKRAPSHTKKSTFEAVARARSLSRASQTSKDTGSTQTTSNWRTSSSSNDTSPTSSSQISRKPSVGSMSNFRSDSTAAHPFVQELAQVSELVAEFGASDGSSLQIIDEEGSEMVSKGLYKLTAQDYVDEIRDAISNFFPEWTPVRPMTALWI